MKRQKIYLVAACLLALLSILAIVYKKGGFSRTASKNIYSAFAVKDTATITRVFIADMFGQKVLLTKNDGKWMVDNHKPVAPYKIRDLLITMNSIRIAKPIAKAAQNSVLEMLAISSTKVEIYETKSLFVIFGMPFFTKERLYKTYFLGDATQTSLASFALLEGMDFPCEIYKPGFRGYVKPLFSPDPVEWYSQLIFSTKLTRIKNVSFVDVQNPESSFFVEKAGPRTFNLFDHQKNAISDYDTLMLVDMLSEFREKHYEVFLPNISQSLKDSILQLYLFKIISVTDVEKRTTTMKLYYFVEWGDLFINDVLIEENYADYNKDRCYATFNDNTDEIFTVQFQQFDRQIQPLAYFLRR
jgi:hypothetical protein